MSLTATQGGRGGCFKCGKNGHWSRDCTAPPDQWSSAYLAELEKRKMAGPGATQPGLHGPKYSQQAQRTQEAAGPNPESRDEAGFEQPSLKKPKRAPRPKLTVELLKDAEKGIPKLFATIPIEFPGMIRGRGHEAGDLRRLLSLYRKWSARLFPHCSFDEFVFRSAEIGTKYAMKTEMRKMRDDAILISRFSGSKATTVGFGSPSTPEREREEAGGNGRASPNVDDEWDEDFEAVIREAEARAAGGSGSSSPNGTRQAPHEGQTQADVEELRRLAGFEQDHFLSQAPAGSSQEPTQGQTQADVEELRRLAGSEQDHFLSQAPAGPSQEPTQGQTQADVEELRRLSGFEQDQPASQIAPGLSQKVGSGIACENGDEEDAAEREALAQMAAALEDSDGEW